MFAHRVIGGHIVLYILTLKVRLGHFIRCPEQISIYSNRTDGITLPANSRTGHRRNNPRPSTTQETTPAKLPLNDSRGVDQPLGRPDLLILRQTAGLKERFDDVERGGDTGRKRTGQTSGDAMGEGVVVLRGIHDLGNRLVCDELGGGEGDGHAERGRVGDVEGLETFGAVDGLGTLADGLMYRAMNLHALLDHCVSKALEAAQLLS